MAEPIAVGDHVVLGHGAGVHWVVLRLYQTHAGRRADLKSGQSDRHRYAEPIRNLRLHTRG